MTLEAARDRFIRERERFVRAAQAIEVNVRREAARRHLKCHVEGRAKDVSSFIKKALVKGYENPWTEITDKAGVRVVAEHIGDIDDLVEVVKDLQDPGGVLREEGKDLAPNELGYSGIHLQILAPIEDDDDPDEPVEVEVQVRTAAQDLWSRASHSLLYKPVLEAPATVARSLYRVQALMELFDHEVQRAVEEISTHPEYDKAQLLRAAESLFHVFVAADYNQELSLEVLTVAVDTIGVNGFTSYADRLVEFVERNTSKLSDIYEDYGPQSEQGRDGSYLLIGQPESIVLFELLSRTPRLLWNNWRERFDDGLLQPLADVWGAQ
jgi:ppGpp synthetase/RelA/SpoT-type nucleotidyltranferase